MITGKSIAKGAMVVMAATLLSRLFGFVREMIIAKHFGLTGATDAYLVAFAIPSGIAMAFAAAISSGFIPVLNSYLVNRDRDNEIKVTNTLLNVIFFFLLLIVGLAMYNAPYLVKLLAPGFSGDSVELTVIMIRLMFPALIFVSLMGLASGFLNSRQHFLFPAMSPMIVSFVVIGSVLILGQSMGIKSLAIGTMLGSACQFAIQLPIMFRKGFRYRPEFAIFHPGVVKSLKLMIPVLIASLAPPLLLLVERALASKLGTGSISALNFAFRLMQLPQGLFVMAVTVPLFPALAAFAAQKDYDRLKTTLIKGIGVLAVIMIPASAGLVALDEPIIRLLFERGAFAAKDTVPTAYALTFYALALLPLAFRDIFRRGFYSLQDTLTPVLVTVGGFILNVGLDFLLVRPMGIGGLALGAALSVAVEVMVLYFLLNVRLRGLPGRAFVLMLVKLIAASIIMGMVSFVFSAFIGSNLNLQTNVARMIQVGSSVIVGLAVYISLVAVLKVEVAGEALEMLKGLYKKFAGKVG